MIRPSPAPAPARWRDAAKVSFDRSVVLAAVGAVIGLTAAGFALFTAKGTSTLVVPAEDVAMVNQQPIARSDYQALLRTLYGVADGQATPSQRRKVLDDLIQEELLVQRGLELDVAAFDPDVRSAMVSSVEQSVAADAVSRQPKEAELKAFYDANQARYANEGVMTAQDRVYPSLAAAAAGLDGRDSGKLDGDEYYFAARIHLGDPLFDIARALPSGGVSAPIALPDGVHVLRMIDNRPPVARTFDSARPQVLGDYTQKAIKRLQDRQARFLRKRANILVAKDLR
ncbi:MAG: peptidyl-prolyl cis-trans isomerase [Caulobacter sp.]|nr:peptidyl-prolyl cis-trans isomerase [Caulobacter sp.]